jgi:hypothetical protein
MTTYTYSKARQDLAALLDEASRSGEVRIRRKDGRVFVVKPERSRKSPLAVKGIKLGLSSKELVQFIHEGRKQR